jgi:hypothetical protein
MIDNMDQEFESMLDIEIDNDGSYFNLTIPISIENTNVSTLYQKLALEQHSTSHFKVLDKYEIWADIEKINVSGRFIAIEFKFYE